MIKEREKGISRKSKWFFVNGSLSLLTGSVGMVGLMAVALFVVYFHYGLGIGLACFIIFCLCFIYYLASVGKLISISPNGVKLYSLTANIFIPWEQILYTGSFYHLIYIGTKKKYYYFSKKPLALRRNPLSLDSLPPMNNDFIFVMDQKGLQEVVAKFQPKRCVK